MKNDGGYAFPFPHVPIPDYEGGKQTRGMTLRDYFAAHATEEDIRLTQVRNEDRTKILSREAARFRYADAMLKEREKWHFQDR